MPIIRPKNYVSRLCKQVCKLLAEETEGYQNWQNKLQGCRVRQKTYNAEFAAIAEYRAKYPECTKLKRLNWKQSQKYFKKIAKSKTYKDLCAKEDASRYGDSQSNT